MYFDPLRKLKNVKKELSIRKKLLLKYNKTLLRLKELKNKRLKNVNNLKYQLSNDKLNTSLSNKINYKLCKSSLVLDYTSAMCYHIERKIRRIESFI